MRKYLALLLFLLLSTAAMPQQATVSIDHVTAMPGSEIVLPLQVTSFNNIGGITMYFSYDPAVLTYVGFQNSASSNFIINGADVSTNPGVTLVSLAYSTISGISIPNGILIEYVFTYLGGNCNLEFDLVRSEVADNSNDAAAVDVAYTNGSVSPLSPEVMVQVIIGSMQATLNQQVSVPVTVKNFANIGAFDFQIAFSTGSLDFVTLANLHADIDPAKLAFNTTGGNVFIGYSMPAGAVAGLTVANDGKLFDLVFLYKGGSSPLSFIEIECDVSDFNDLATLPVLYTDGEVTAAEVFDATVTIANVVSPPGLNVDVPVTATGLDLLGAFDFAIGYIPANLTFSGIENINPLLSANGILVPNVSGSTIYIAWSLTGTPANGLEIPDNDKLFDIRFTALSGVPPLTFDLIESEMSRLKEEIEVSNYNVTYVDGSVTVTEETQLTIRVMLEGFYNSGAANMNMAKDFVGGMIIDKFPETVADVIRIELHEEGSYGTPVFYDDDVALNQNGLANVIVPGTTSGSYYVTVKHRNHLETVSASTVSFAGTVASHDFTTAASQAYGNNQKLLGAGVYGMYAGDVNQDGIINPIDRDMANIGFRTGLQGYVPEDVNGDGIVNPIDRDIANIGFRMGIVTILPVNQ